MLKSLSVAALAAALLTPAAVAGPAERLVRADVRVAVAKHHAVAPRAVHPAAAKARYDRVEDRFDRREDVRDRAVNRGPLDRVEDRVDRAENVLDRRNYRFARRL